MYDLTPHSWYPIPTPGVEELGLALTGAGRIEAQGRKVTGRALPAYGAVLVMRGSGGLSHGRSPASCHRIAEGTLFWLPPYVPHSYGPDRGTWSERWVLFQGPATTAYEKLGLLGAGEPTIRPPDPRKLECAFDELADVAARPASLARDLAAGAALQRLIALATSCGSAPKTTRPSLGEQVVALLEEYAFEPLSLTHLARRLTVAPDTLTAAVRQTTGCTPTDYLLRVRIMRAKVLLTTTDLAVAAVGRRVGYQDPAYFSRLFAHRVGLPPSAFRRQQRTTRARADQLGPTLP
ncbi:helix-turn-helix domain-containing protein [Streptomyces sp. NPDC048428]|uniref:helix-turn-helix domain-containing protein n=1 Tax=Streptomyces sp. NPDC048428 TaxID=3154503 RepID=UPI0034481856